MVWVFRFMILMCVIIFGDGSSLRYVNHRGDIAPRSSVLLRRQSNPSLGSNFIDAAVGGLRDIGKHVVGGFSKLTGIELPDVQRSSRHVASVTYKHTDDLSNNVEEIKTDSIPYVPTYEDIQSQNAAESFGYFVPEPFTSPFPIYTHTTTSRYQKLENAPYIRQLESTSNLNKASHVPQEFVVQDTPQSSDENTDAIFVYENSNHYHHQKDPVYHHEEHSNSISNVYDIPVTIKEEPAYYYANPVSNYEDPYSSLDHYHNSVSYQKPLSNKKPPLHKKIQYDLKRWSDTVVSLFNKVVPKKVPTSLVASHPPPIATYQDTGYASDDVINTGYVFDDAINTGYVSDDARNTGYASDDAINTGYASDDAINTGYASDDAINTGYASDDGINDITHETRPFYYKGKPPFLENLKNNIYSWFPNRKVSSSSSDEDGQIKTNANPVTSIGTWMTKSWASLMDTLALKSKTNIQREDLDNPQKVSLNPNNPVQFVSDNRDGVPPFGISKEKFLISPVQDGLTNYAVTENHHSETKKEPIIIPQNDNTENISDKVRKMADWILSFTPLAAPKTTTTTQQPVLYIDYKYDPFGTNLPAPISEESGAKEAIAQPSNIQDVVYAFTYEQPEYNPADAWTTAKTSLKTTTTTTHSDVQTQNNQLVDDVTRNNNDNVSKSHEITDTFSSTPNWYLNPHRSRKNYPTSNYADNIINSLPHNELFKLTAQGKSTVYSNGIAKSSTSPVISSAERQSTSKNIEIEKLEPTIAGTILNENISPK